MKDVDAYKTGGRASGAVIVASPGTEVSPAARREAENRGVTILHDTRQLPSMLQKAAAEHGIGSYDSRHGGYSPHAGPQTTSGEPDMRFKTNREAAAKRK